MFAGQTAFLCIRCMVIAGITLLLNGKAAAFEFSAERTMRIGDRSTVAHVYAVDDRWKFEYAQPQGGVAAAIVRQDRGQAWILFERTKTYAEIPIPEDLKLSVHETMEGEVSREFIGLEEDVNGFPTELFEVTTDRHGQQKRYYQWVIRSLRFAIKTISKDGDQRLEYRHINFSKQPSLYFTLPVRYRPAQIPQ